MPAFPSSVVSRGSRPFLAAAAWLVAAGLVVALASGVPGATDLDLSRSLWAWAGLSVPAALLGVALLLESRRTASGVAAAPVPAQARRLVGLVAVVWGLFRFLGSAVTGVFAVAGAWSTSPALAVRDGLLLAVLAVSGAGLTYAGLRLRTLGPGLLLRWAGAGLVVAALVGVAAAAAGSAIAAALLLSAQALRRD